MISDTLDISLALKWLLIHTLRTILHESSLSFELTDGMCRNYLRRDTPLLADFRWWHGHPKVHHWSAAVKCELFSTRHFSPTTRPRGVSMISRTFHNNGLVLLNLFIKTCWWHGESTWNWDSCLQCKVYQGLSGGLHWILWNLPRNLFAISSTQHSTLTVRCIKTIFLGKVGRGPLLRAATGNQGLTGRLHLQRSPGWAHRD